MAKKLTTHFIDLTQDACLKAFWRRPALRTFLKQHHISDAKLATWHEDETKRAFLRRLFSLRCRRLVLLRSLPGLWVSLLHPRSLHFRMRSAGREPSIRSCSLLLEMSTLLSKMGSRQRRPDYRH